MSNTVVKAKIAVSDFRPKRIHGMPDTQRELSLGTLIGKATGVVRRTLPTGEVMEGIGGTFAFQPSDDGDVISSGVLWLPSGVDNLVLDPLRASEGTGSNAVINIAFEIKVIRADNPAGYSYAFRPLLEETVKVEDDPLGALRGLLPTRSTAPALEDKSKK